MNPDLLAVIEKIITADLQALKREDKDYDFKDVHQYISSIHANAKLLKQNEEYWEQTPADSRNDITTWLRDFSDHIEAIKNFDPKSIANALGRRDELANGITALYKHLYVNFLVPFNAFLGSRKGDSLTKQKILSEAKEIVEAAKKNKEETDNILASIQKASGTAGVSAHAEIFDRQADVNRNLAITWLIASILGISSSIWFLWSYIVFPFIESLNKNLDPNAFIQLLLGKLIILSFFSVLVYQLLRNFNANQHLYTLNKHRANCLRTFETFSNAATDPQTKDAVLIQATKSIFDAGDTGFISNKDGSSGTTENIILERIKQ